MKAFFTTLTMLALSALPTRAEDIQWTANLAHYDFPEPYDAWVISPASDETGEPRGFRGTVEAIYSQDKNPRIQHVYLGTSFHRDDLQTEVVSYLEKQKLFSDSLPPFGKWTFKGSGEVQKLVSKALLQSKFVASLDKVLSPHKQRISSVSMEKLFFTKEHDKILWHGVVWLLVEPSVYQSSGANAASPRRSL